MWPRCLQWIPDDLFRFLQSHHFLLTIHLSHWDFIFLTLEIKEGNFFAAISLLIICVLVDDWSFEEIPWEKRKYSLLSYEITCLHHFLWCGHQWDLEILKPDQIKENYFGFSNLLIFLSTGHFEGFIRLEVRSRYMCLRLCSGKLLLFNFPNLSHLTQVIGNQIFLCLFSQDFQLAHKL